MDSLSFLFCFAQQTFLFFSGPTSFECESCHDDPRVCCQDCSCYVCGGKNDPDKQIICDDCDRLYHLWCLRPPLQKIPPEDDQWFCPDCKNNDEDLIRQKESFAWSQRLGSKEWMAKNKTTKKKKKKKKKSSEYILLPAQMKQETSEQQEKKRKRQHMETMITSSHSLSRDFFLSNEVMKRKEESSIRSEEMMPKDHQKRLSWGPRGMACVGRRRVQDYNDSSTFFGSIPGIEVGSCWRFRFQVSEVGLHSPLISGIAGKESIGASSVVFSGSYPDDVDLGDEIYFTGSGGFHLTRSSSRTALGKSQIRNQTLTRSNKALAMSCAAAFNDVTGGFAGKDWKEGKPIRLLRSGNTRGSHKTSKFLPRIGIRYDGLYKVVKYWPEKKETNDASDQLIVWRFLLRRDDDTPSPWTREGRNRIRRLQLDHLMMPDLIPKTQSLKEREILKCVICLDSIIDDAVTTICHHSFCRVRSEFSDFFDPFFLIDFYFVVVDTGLSSKMVRHQRKQMSNL